MSLIKNPVKWSDGLVGSWGLFAGTAVGLVVFTGAFISMTANGGLSGSILTVAILATWQVMMLYAIRRLLMRVEGQEITPLQLKRHTQISIVLFVLVGIVVAVKLMSKYMT